MCIGVPVLLTAVDGIHGAVLEDGRPGAVDLSLVPEARPGDWLLAFLGTAREVIAAEEARKIAAALDGLRAVMQGGALGDAFADLENREPSLPPHLEAARAAGRTTA